MSSRAASTAPIEAVTVASAARGTPLRLAAPVWRAMAAVRARPMTVMPTDQAIASASVRSWRGMACERTIAATAPAAQPIEVAPAAYLLRPMAYRPRE